MDADHVLTARAIGLRPMSVRKRHIVPGARLPIVTQIALNIGFVIGGAITVEALFSWPGVGLLTLQAIENKDFPMLEGIYLVSSALVIICNLAADLLYARLDPQGEHAMSIGSTRRDRGHAPHPERAGSSAKRLAPHLFSPSRARGAARSA